MYDYINELLKEHISIVYWFLFLMFLYYFIHRIGYQFDKMNKKKEEITDSYGDAIENLGKSTVIKSNEQYDKRKREIIEDYHRRLTRLSDDFKSEQLFFISQCLIVIGSLLVVVVIVLLPL